MPRGLFDPSRMAVKQPPDPPPTTPGEQPPLTVSQLASLVDQALRTTLPRKVRVLGEVSGFNDRTHWYFSLKDAEAVISCVMFASAARSARFRPENGHEVVATGRIEFFAKQGRTQFYVEKMEPVGAGALDLEFKRLCDELRALGWFDPERKRPLPRFPRRIGVITSRTGAALQDVIDTMRRRAPGVSISLIDVRVQGDGAAAQIAHAIRRAGEFHAELSLDALLVTRGGGSREDLWAFNERIVAQAIVSCPIPVVAAIGHETDTSIAELVADERCATPTQAAMRLTPDTAALIHQLDSYADRLRFVAARSVADAAGRLTQSTRHAHAAIRSGIQSAAHRLVVSGARLEKHRPAALYARRDSRLLDARARLRAAITARIDETDTDAPTHDLLTAMERAITRSAESLESRARALELVGPASVLRRGYTATLRADGQAVRSTSDVAPGDRLRTIVADGEITSRVEPGTAPAAPPPRRRAPKAPDGPTLFP